MFQDFVIRLMKTQWPTAQLLAEELIAMFENAKLAQAGPITLTQTGDNPFFTLKDWKPGDVIMEVKGPGGISLGNITFTGSTISFGGGGSGGGGTSITVEGGGGMPGQVESRVSGNDYNVTVYPAGIPAGGMSVVATQLQIHADDEIPVGTWALVVKAGDYYYMQVPILVE